MTERDNQQASAQVVHSEDGASTADELAYCPDCGEAIYVVPVVLTGGVRRYLPVSMVPWSGERTALRLSRSPDGTWRTAPLSGAWMEHRCPNPLTDASRLLRRSEAI